MNRQIIRMIRNCFKRVKLTQRVLIYFYKTGVQNQPTNLASNQHSYKHNVIQNREQDRFQFTSTTTPCNISLQMQNLACGNLPQPRSAQNSQAQEQVITKVLSQLFSVTDILFEASTASAPTLPISPTSPTGVQEDIRGASCRHHQSRRPCRPVRRRQSERDRRGGTRGYFIS